MSMLPHDQRIFLKIGNVIERWLRQEFEQQPSNVGVEKTFADVVGIFVVVDMFVVASMLACPHQDRILKRTSTEEKREQAHWQSRPESRVRKQTVITERDAEAGRGQQRCEQAEVEPSNTEIPKVKRHCRKCENKRADQERTRRPIDAADGNTENQGSDLDRLTGSLIPAENNILLFPCMYAAAVFAGELLFFEFGCCPTFFFDCSSGIGQL